MTRGRPLRDRSNDARAVSVPDSPRRSASANIDPRDDPWNAAIEHGRKLDLGEFPSSIFRPSSNSASTRSSCWSGFLMPAGTPPEVVARANAAISAAVESPRSRRPRPSSGWRLVSGRQRHSPTRSGRAGSGIAISSRNPVSRRNSAGGADKRAPSLRLPRAMRRRGRPSGAPRGAAAVVDLNCRLS